MLRAAAIAGGVKLPHGVDAAMAMAAGVHPALLRRLVPKLPHRLLPALP